ncbi:hypothetical protein FE633_13285 [Streptomyces montanus]|uniref:Uncharacterized protein n=1 Tax=Streptomyces montanus TaxID=2580423 RepID=A0A5R9G2F5_9ACTN|nr:hypothetical protein [Streptomyces montanus]TLS45735.1 hypothetical protein FE633_13285 [Streptomyces montanus]
MSTANTLYEIETNEAEDGTPYPAEHLWTPVGEDAEAHGFITHRGLQISGTRDHLYGTHRRFRPPEAIRGIQRRTAAHQGRSTTSA